MSEHTPASGADDAAAPVIGFDADGHPVSPRYGDVYKSRAGALDEASEVFVGGCRLRERWAGAPAFVVLELGFGLGVNFLATLRAWREDPRRPPRLHYVSVEAHPVAADALRRAHAALKLPCAADAEALAAQWPMALPGLQPLRFDDGAVTLTVVVGDAARVVPRLALAADALFLDGFAPARNPVMWTAPLMKSLARLARPGALASTYTAAVPVREALAAAGFDVSLVPGFGGKRERIEAVYAPRWRTFPPPPPPPGWSERAAIVVGAGLAGCHLAGTLAERGWGVTLLERREGPAREGSSQPAVADHLHVSPDDNTLARLSRAALLMRQGRRAVPALAPPAGKLQVASDASEHRRQAEMVERLGFPPAFLQSLDRDAASDVAGVALAQGALWLPLCATTDPGEACRTALGTGGRVALRTGTLVGSLRRDGAHWTALDARGDAIASAPVVVLANAGDAVRLAGMASAGLRRLRGQTTMLGAGVLPGLRTALGGDAYACPLPDGRVLAGSTYDDLDGLEPDPEADLSNLRRLRRILADGVLPESVDTRCGPAAVGFRFAARDRMPLIGALPDEASARATATELARNDRLAIPVIPGVYGAFAFGSRGALWATLAAEIVADALDGAPMPVERDLLEAVAPDRMLRQGIRSRRLR